MHHDLVLIVDAGEKQLFDAIDGRRTIAEIVDAAGHPAAWTQVRAFFEQLWRYDQVVFDASNGVVVTCWWANVSPWSTDKLHVVKIAALPG